MVRANVASILVVACALSWLIATSALSRAGRTREAVPEPPARRSAAVRAIDDALIARIRDAMETRRLYREESLTVAGLAETIGSQEYRVRRAINQGLGYRNFNELLHRYRLDEASARLRAQPHLPVLTIALDVGFGSIGPFNRAFRAKYGCTPTEYRAAASGIASTAHTAVRGAD